MPILQNERFISLKFVKFHDPVFMPGMATTNALDITKRPGLELTWYLDLRAIEIKLSDTAYSYKSITDAALWTTIPESIAIVKVIPQVEQTNPIAEELNLPRGKTQVRSSAQVSDPTRDPVFGKGK